MRTLSIAMLSVLGLAAGWAPSVQAQRLGVWIGSAGVTYLQPDAARYWDSGPGGEVQVQRWVTDDIGLGAHVGMSTLDMTTITGTQNGNATRLSGDADFVNAGASLLFRSPMTKSKRWTAMAELGVEVSNMSVSGSYDVTTASGTASNELDAQSGVNFRTAVDLERRIFRSLMLFGGVGYQINISAPNVKSQFTVDGVGYNARELTEYSENRSTDGLVLRLGLRKIF